MIFGEKTGTWNCQVHCHTCVSEPGERVLFIPHDVETSFYQQLRAGQEHNCLQGYPTAHSQGFLDQVPMLWMYMVAVPWTSQTPNLLYFCLSQALSYDWLAVWFGVWVSCEILVTDLEGNWMASFLLFLRWHLLGGHLRKALICWARGMDVESASSNVLFFSLYSWKAW